ncbi:MAG TPA: cupin domain-containing protein [Devosia sp.]
MPAVESYIFADDGVFPNSRLPVLIYRSVVSDGGPEALERLFKRNGWPPQWRDTVFTFHHYHSRSHECLGVATGHATLRLGGPEGQVVRVEAGDVVMIPAGVAHPRVVASADFMVVGAYPPGQENFDTLRGNREDRPKADENIAEVPKPQSDPVEGSSGSLLELWR